MRGCSDQELLAEAQREEKEEGQQGRPVELQFQPPTLDLPCHAACYISALPMFGHPWYHRMISRRC